MLSGTAAGIGKTVGAPVERVKLLIQSQDEMLKSGRLDKPYAGMIECGKRTFQNEGAIAFWRGNSANVIRYNAFENLCPAPKFCHLREVSF